MLLVLTNVDDMPLSVQHNIAVVSVFDLQEEADDRVSGHALDEVGTCLLYKNGISRSQQWNARSLRSLR